MTALFPYVLQSPGSSAGLIELVLLQQTDGENDERFVPGRRHRGRRLLHFSLFQTSQNESSCLYCF